MGHLLKLQGEDKSFLVTIVTNLRGNTLLKSMIEERKGVIFRIIFC